MFYITKLSFRHNLKDLGVLGAQRRRFPDRELIGWQVNRDLIVEPKWRKPTRP